MKADEPNDTGSTGSSLSGIYKNIFKSQTPVCMFYFSHPFGISTPSSANNRCGLGGGGGGCGSDGESKKARKKSRYKTKTYLVTEIEKHQSDGSQDECEEERKATANGHERDLLPWPKNFLLPPFVQMIEKKHGKKLPDFDAILRQVRKQAWNTPKSHHSHSFWSRGSSISSDDFSSLASPDSLYDKPTTACKARLRRKLRDSQPPVATPQQQHSKMESSTAGNGHGKAQTFLKRRYSVPEIIMRKYSLAQQRSYEEASVSVYSSETISRRNGQSTTAINKRPIQSQTPPSQRTASPIKYFIPLSPQSNIAAVTTSSSSSTPPPPPSASFAALHHHHGEISMRKQTLLRRMWSREFQHSKYSGSWSPPLRKATHHTRSTLRKFNTLPEFVSASCEKCKELGVLSRDEDLCESKEDKSQQTDFEEEEEERKREEEQQQHFSSASSSASTIIQSASNEAIAGDSIKNSSSTAAAAVETDSNGNNIIICMTALQDHRQQQSENVTAGDNPEGEEEEMLQVEIDGNNNNSSCSGSSTAANASVEGKYLRKQFSTQLEDEGYHPAEDHASITYRRLREEKLSETEIDQYISQMLIDNLNNVIRTVNENLQANGEHNLVKIDFAPNASEVVETLAQSVQSALYSGNNKLRNQQQHEIAIQMRNAKNGDSGKNRNSNEPVSLNTTTAVDVSSEFVAVERDPYENAEVNSAERYSYVESKSVSEHSTTSDSQVTAIINTGTSYPHNLSRPASILVPRVIGPKTESMEVNPSSSSAQEDDEFDGMPDSDEDEDISDVDSLDDVVTIRAKRLTEIAHQQHKKAQALFRQTHLKGQAFFVPIVDSEQPIDEHIVVADTMPERLKERLVLRQRRRDMKKQTELKLKQWRMQKFIERKMEQMNVVNDYLTDLSASGGAFKIIGMSSKQTPIEASGYRRSAGAVGGIGGGGGWVPKQRVQTVNSGSVESTSEKSSSKSRKLRNEIGMLESYKIDARGNMQIQAPKAEKEKPPLKPKIKRTSVSEAKRIGAASVKVKLKVTPSELSAGGASLPSRRSVPSSRRGASHIPTSSASSSAAEAVVVGDARRRQIMKDVQQMSVYKNDLTPDPDSGPSRKMWKTEIQEGDKHIEILEIVECVDGHTIAPQAPEPHNDNFNDNFNHHHQHHLFASPPSTQKLFHIPSATSNYNHHPMYVNKTFSVRASGFDNRHHHMYASKIPVPVQHRQMRNYHHYRHRDTSPPTSNNQSSSTTTDAEDSLTSAGSSVNHQPPPSKVDRMIANLLMEALKSPEELGIEFINARRVKRRSQSPAGADSSSTGYYTGDSSRRSASNSAGKYHHRFEVIPEEKSSFSVDSSNDDFDEEDESVRHEKLNNINSDWKSKKNLQNNDIKTRNSTPQKPPESDATAAEREEEEKENDAEGREENNNAEEEEEEDEKSGKANRLSPAKRSPRRAVTNSGSLNVNNSNNLKASTDKSAKTSPARSPSRSVKSNKSSTSGAESTSANVSPEKKRRQPQQPQQTNATDYENNNNKDSTETKSFMMFTDDNENENENGNVAMAFGRSLMGEELEEEEEVPSTAQKSEDTAFHTEHNHFPDGNLIHHFMSHKNSSSSSPANNHFHYHLYQYQTNHCCFNLPDQSKSSSTVTTAATPHDNYSSHCHAMTNSSSCPPTAAADIASTVSQSKTAASEKPKSIETSVRFDITEPPTLATTSSSSGGGFSEFPSQLFNKLDNATPLSSYDDATSRGNTAEEKIIAIELTNELLKRPQQQTREDADDCSCTKKYLPYKVNEKNVWQVYETSDCKYIHSKHEIDEVFQPPLSGDSTAPSEQSNFLHSRSNFSNQIICHAINHEPNHGESFNSSSYTPTFNIKPVSECNHCRGERRDDEEDESASKTAVDDDDEVTNEIVSNQSTVIREAFPSATGKLLNRPKATNNISRDQVKPVEKEIQREISTQGGNTNNTFKSSPKPIRLPSPVPKQQAKRNNSYEENSNSSNESSSSSSSSSAESQCESVKRSKASPKQKSDGGAKEKVKVNHESSLMKQENKSVIPNIHQGWSVTVAGTHPDLAPDVEMKICFPKSTLNSQSATVVPTITQCEPQKPESDVFYYKNNQLMPASVANQSANPMSYEPKPQYYNHRRSLSLARIDSGLSGMAKPKTYNLPNLHVPRATARNFKQVECTTISASKTIIPSRRSLSLDVGNRRLSYDSRSQASPFTPSEMLSVVGSEIKKTLKPKVKTMSERDLTKRHLNCFTRSNGHIF